MSKFLFFIFLLLPNLALCQGLYFPPASGTWTTMSPSELAWNADSLESLKEYLDDKNTKGFLILKEGKLVVEWYFDSFTEDSLWYWASAGKAMTASLVGIAQQEGLLDIDDPTSDYLGQGWTSSDSAQEAAITIYHQLTMSTGLNEKPDPDCTADSCLTYLAPAGSRWFYYNAPYTLLTYVVEAASGRTINQYMFSKILQPTGMNALYFPVGENRIVLSTARDFARFGLLILAQGNWNGTQVIDSSWVYDMTHPSQTLNPSYGYLWWLNGQGSYIQPGVAITFPGDMIPTAPEDLFAGMGKNDQRVYVVPSQDLVVVRMGNQAGQSFFALSQFDSDLWRKITNLGNPNTSVDEVQKDRLLLYPNPTQDLLRWETDFPVKQWRLYSMKGKLLLQGNEPVIQLQAFPPGAYLLEVEGMTGRRVYRNFMRQ